MKHVFPGGSHDGDPHSTTPRHRAADSPEAVHHIYGMGRGSDTNSEDVDSSQGLGGWNNSPKLSSSVEKKDDDGFNMKNVDSSATAPKMHYFNKDGEKVQVEDDDDSEDADDVEDDEADFDYNQVVDDNAAAVGDSGSKDDFSWHERDVNDKLGMASSRSATARRLDRLTASAGRGVRKLFGLFKKCCKKLKKALKKVVPAIKKVVARVVDKVVKIPIIAKIIEPIKKIAIKVIEKVKEQIKAVVAVVKIITGGKVDYVKDLLDSNVGWNYDAAADQAMKTIPLSDIEGALTCTNCYFNMENIIR
jgi:hypothetical protein